MARLICLIFLADKNFAKNQLEDYNEKSSSTINPITTNIPLI